MYNNAEDEVSVDYLLIGEYLVDLVKTTKEIGDCGSDNDRRKINMKNP